MTYKLQFLPTAKKEWDTLDNSLKSEIRKKLFNIRENPHVPCNHLSGFTDQFVYKIKMRQSGYRLFYRVLDDTIVIEIISVGKRDKIYHFIKNRL